MPPVPLSNLGANSFSRSRASISLDALRATAALLVLTDHTRHTFFVEYHEVFHHRFALFLPYLLSSAGHQAVVIFFVLSGFLVGGSIFRSLERDTWTWKCYLTQRFTRLWLVLLPALCLVLLWDSIHLHLLSQHPAYAGSVLQHLISPDAWQTLNAHTLLANAAFLQGNSFFGSGAVPTLGTNGPLWSLANEFWYYLLFPLGLFALRPHYRPSQRLVFAIAFAAVACFVGKDILLMFPFWLSGAFLAILPRSSFNLRSRLVATTLYAAAFLGCTAVGQRHRQLSDYALTLATAAFLWALLAASTQPSRNGLWEHVARLTARFSYTLYLVHMPMLYLLAGFVIHDTRWQPTLRGT
ncbi:MAG: acyltransferase, partial [Granulicella sp.]